MHRNYFRNNEPFNNHNIWEFFSREFYLERSRNPNESDFYRYFRYLKSTGCPYETMCKCLNVLDYEFNRRFSGDSLRNFTKVRRIIDQTKRLHNKKEPRTFTLEDIIKFSRLKNNTLYFLVRKAMAVVLFCCGLNKVEALEIMMNHIKHDKTNKVFRIDFVNDDGSKNEIFSRFTKAFLISRKNAPEFYDVINKYLITVRHEYPYWQGYFFLNPRGINSSKFHQQRLGKHSFSDLPHLIAKVIGLVSTNYTAICWTLTPTKEKNRFLIPVSKNILEVNTTSVKLLNNFNDNNYNEEENEREIDQSMHIKVEPSSIDIEVRDEPLLSSDDENIANNSNEMIIKQEQMDFTSFEELYLSCDLITDSDDGGLSNQCPSLDVVQKSVDHVLSYLESTSDQEMKRFQPKLYKFKKTLLRNSHHFR